MKRIVVEVSTADRGISGHNALGLVMELYVIYTIPLTITYDFLFSWIRISNTEITDES